MTIIWTDYYTLYFKIIHSVNFAKIKSRTKSFSRWWRNVCWLRNNNNNNTKKWYHIFLSNVSWLKLKLFFNISNIFFYFRSAFNNALWLCHSEREYEKEIDAIDISHENIIIIHNLIHNIFQYSLKNTKISYNMRYYIIIIPYTHINVFINIYFYIFLLYLYIIRIKKIKLCSHNTWL